MQDYLICPAKSHTLPKGACFNFIHDHSVHWHFAFQKLTIRGSEFGRQTHICIYVVFWSKIAYTASNNDPLDEAWLAANLEEVKALFRSIPKGNGKYSMFVRAVLHMMDAEDYTYANVPSTRKAKLEEAEEVATMIRGFCFHLRREWYRKSTKPFMRHFPRPPSSRTQPAPEPAAAPAPSGASASLFQIASAPALSGAAAALIANHSLGDGMLESMFSLVRYTVSL